MNPGIGAPELLVLVILALVVVGPKDLPLMVRKVGQFMGNMRGLARDFQRSFDELGREAELAELRKEIDDLKKANPLNEVRREFEMAEKEALRDDLEDRPHPRTPEKGAPLKGEPLTDFEAIEPVKYGASGEPEPVSSDGDDAGAPARKSG
ncbi:MAG: Sec-independent protein translocase protein TatB [Alphaproteobacteria bacterium]|nr:Sec-independent protein translocase protein TatB [Alphaproteobacteria bacterium]